MLALGRATQHMYYPEFLSDVARPRGLAWSSMADRPDGISESFGTIRYGRLAEVLLYDIRRTATLAGPSAVYVDLEVERWLPARIMAAMSAMKARAPLVVSGDMHSIALGKMLRSGDHDFNANPITVCLSGTGGTRPLGWPSAGFRKTPALPSQVLDFVEQVKPLELHGFTLVDFLQDKMVLQQFRWDMKTQTVEMIDTLQPFHTAELPRPA